MGHFPYSYKEPRQLSSMKVYEMLFPMIFDRKKSSDKYKYPVYRSDGQPLPLSARIIKEMDEDELWEELKRLCKKD
jgi:hypothetical protein